MLGEWSKTNLRYFPWREGKSPYSILLTEILLKRTTSKAAASVYHDFLETYPNMVALAEADKATLQSMLKRIGLQIQRTRAIIEMAGYVVKNFGGEIPSSKEDLERIPHVGSYTAAAVRSFGYGIRDAVVDSNVMRIIRRLFAKAIGKRKVSLSEFQQLAEMLLPEKHQNHNFAMVDLGALVCRYDYPRCWFCPLKKACDTGSKTQGSNRSRRTHF